MLVTFSIQTGVETGEIENEREGGLRSRSHFPPIRAQGTSFTRTQEHSTTAAPYCSMSSLSAGEMIFFALGLVFVS